eukprot:317502-Pelagomonas_calceolata.AAC.1
MQASHKTPDQLVSFACTARTFIPTAEIGVEIEAPIFNEVLLSAGQTYTYNHKKRTSQQGINGCNNLEIMYPRLSKH